MAYDFKLSEPRLRIPKDFLTAYPVSQVDIMHRGDYLPFMVVDDM